MAIQFAGSSSTGSRRRRRLAVNGDGADVDSSLLDGDGAEIESQLVASHAAAPWVPVTELRIWIYAAIIGLFLGGLTFVHIRPFPFRAEVAPLADHLFSGPRPSLLVVVETVFLTLSAQLGMLIGWYRSRGKLDFGGRYRVWSWAVGLFGIVAFCAATNIHQTFGEVAKQSASLQWRGHIVSWLLPLCAAALPITLLLDRDMRNSRSSLYFFRLSVGLWLATAWMEIYQTELTNYSWFSLARHLMPVFASATLFLGLWLHARIVAYVCPDPPELEERSAWSVLLASGGFMASCLMFWRWRRAPESEDDDAQPKRRRKKTVSEEATARRKKRAPAKKAAPRTRTRTKPSEEEAEESSDDATSDDSDASAESSDDSYESSNQEESYSGNDQSDDENRWDEPEESPQNRASSSKSGGRTTQVHQSHSSSVPAPHLRRQPQSQQQPASRVEEASNSYDDASDENDEDRQLQMDSGMTSDQMKGLSKRQKRELRKQMRDQERTRGR